MTKSDIFCPFMHGDLVECRGKRMIFDDVKKVGNKRYYTFFYVDSRGDFMTRRSELEYIDRFEQLDINYADKLDTFKELFEVKNHEAD